MPFYGTRSPEEAQRIPGNRASFTKRTLFRSTSPIRRKQTIFNISMQRRMRPINGTRHVPMFDRIDMHVIHMYFKIAVVTDGVLPKPLLP